MALRAIDDAKAACSEVGVEVSNQFVEATKMASIGMGKTRKLNDYLLSRFACYLIAMNGEPHKPEIAAAQTYFALQTRRQELADEGTTYEEQRLALRSRVTENNKKLMGAAKGAGVTRFGLFNEAGYRAMYGGLGLPDILQRKGLLPKSKLLDHAGRAELAAHDFRITQTELRLQSDAVSEERTAISVHREVGDEVRTTMKRTGKRMPEDLPAERNIKEIERERKRRLTSQSKSNALKKA